MFGEEFRQRAVVGRQHGPETTVAEESVAGVSAGLLGHRETEQFTTLDFEGVGCEEDLNWKQKNLHNIIKVLCGMHSTPWREVH